MAARILVCNDGVASPNKGDQAILMAMREAFARYLGDAEVRYMPYSGSRTPARLAALFSCLLRSDLLVLGGGHPFQDLTSQMFLLFGLGLLSTARLLGVRTLCYAVGAGPIEKEFSRACVPRVLNLCDRIAVRDAVSFHLLRELGVQEEKLVLTADAAFDLSSIAPERALQLLCGEGVPVDAKPRFAVSLRRWFCFSHRFLPAGPRRPRGTMRAEAEYLTQVLVDFLDWLVVEVGATIVFVPMRAAQGVHDYGQDDDRYSAEVRERLVHKDRTYLLRADYRPDELKGIFSQMDAVISVRMHPLVLAAAAGVPVLGIPFTAAKGEGLFEGIGQPDDYVYITELTFERLCGRFLAMWRRRGETAVRLRARTSVLREMARVNAALVAELSGCAAAPGAGKTGP